MKQISKPQGFRELAETYLDKQSQIAAIEKEKESISEKLAYLFTDIRVGDKLTVSFQKKKALEYFVFSVEFYSKFHLKEPIYDEQFVVKIFLVRKGLEIRELLITANGEECEGKIVKKIRR